MHSKINVKTTTLFNRIIAIIAIIIILALNVLEVIRKEWCWLNVNLLTLVEPADRNNNGIDQKNVPKSIIHS